LIRFSASISVALAVFASSQALALDVPANWITLAAGDAFTMQTPPGTHFRKEQGIDSFASGFDGPNFSMDFDYGIYSPTLSDLAADPKYKAEKTAIDGIPVLIVSGPGNNNFGCQKWMVAIHTGPIKQGILGSPNTLTLGACIENPSDIPRIRTIFQTLKFHR